MAPSGRPDASVLRLGIVSDLHGLFDPLLPKVLAQVDSILVAGDIVDETLLERLRAIAPIHAVRGNNDMSPALLALPEFLGLPLLDLRLLIAHDRNDHRMPGELARHRPDILLVGHSHQPAVSLERKLLVVNPGSAGPRRFRLPRTAGTLTLTAGKAPEVGLWDLDRDEPYRVSSS
jgi:putative phosphoesterase